MYLKECFEKNKVDGRMLVFVTSSTLPQIGVTDFEHIKVSVAALL